MTFESKLSPEQWAEAKRLRARGASFESIAQHVGIVASALSRRSRKEGWPSSAPKRPTPTGARRARGGRPSSPATAVIRSRLALRLYAVIECKIRIMELRMIKDLQAYEKAGSDGLPPPPIADERESFAALIDSINRVTEMASEPAPAADGRRKSVAGAINPELTALSDDIDPDGLAIASEKDQYRREVAEHLGRMFPKP
jgi:hypothetical protein